MGKFVIKQAKTGPMFNLKAGNGEVIATSEVYTTEAACKNGIASVTKNAPVAAIEDQTEEGFATQKNPKFEIYTDKPNLENVFIELVNRPVKKNTLKELLEEMAPAEDAAESDGSSEEKEEK